MRGARDGRPRRSLPWTGDTDIPSPGRRLLLPQLGLPLSAPLHFSFRPLPPASPLLTCSALNREGGGGR